MEFTREIEIVSLGREEIALLKLIRKLGYGNLEITVQDGKPVMAKKVTENIKLSY